MGKSILIACFCIVLISCYQEVKRSCEYITFTPPIGSIIAIKAKKPLDTIYVGFLTIIENRPWSFDYKNIGDTIANYASRGYKIDSILNSISSAIMYAGKKYRKESSANFIKMYPNGELNKLNASCDCADPKVYHSCICCVIE